MTHQKASLTLQYLTYYIFYRLQNLNNTYKTARKKSLLPIIYLIRSLIVKFYSKQYMVFYASYNFIILIVKDIHMKNQLIKCLNLNIKNCFPFSNLNEI